MSIHWYTDDALCKCISQIAEDKESVRREYYDLKNLDKENLAQKKRYKTASMEINKCRNRFTDVLANEDSRVLLTSGNYVNANSMKIPLDTLRHSYIMTQHPTRNTLNEFWEMVFQFKVRCIVQLNDASQDDYLDSRFYEASEVDYKIFMESADYCSIASTKIRKFAVQCKKNFACLRVTHFHYLAWPDKGVPRSITDLNNLLCALDDLENGQGNNIHILVHCKAGVGRTGTFVTIHTALQLANASVDFFEGSASIFRIVQYIKLCRSLSVQSGQQHSFCYGALEFILKDRIKFAKV